MYSILTICKHSGTTNKSCVRKQTTTIELNRDSLKLAMNGLQTSTAACKRYTGFWREEKRSGFSKSLLFVLAFGCVVRLFYPIHKGFPIFCSLRTINCIIFVYLFLVWSAPSLPMTRYLAIQSNLVINRIALSFLPKIIYFTGIMNFLYFFNSMTFCCSCYIFSAFSLIKCFYIFYKLITTLCKTSSLYVSKAISNQM